MGDRKNKLQEKNKLAALDKELNELTVFPYIELLFLTHTTVIPVENLLSVFLKLLVFTFFITFFAYKLNQPTYFF